MREIMDTYNDPNIETTVFFKPTQIGGTEAINNIFGYIIDQDPGPVMIVLPTRDQGKVWSKKRLAPMIRATKCLHSKIRRATARDEDNTILNKEFKGGHITISGANAPATLASQPIRVLLCDEIDKYPVSAGVEGDPIALANKRTQTFWNRKHFYTGTGTIKGLSRIEKWYDLSDRRKYWVTCPYCNHKMIFSWKQVHWDGNDASTAHYSCPGCNGKIADGQRFEMIRTGKWIAECPGRPVAGFWINGIYSPWITFKQMVKEYLDAKKDTETYKTWVNTFLAETYEEQGLVVEYEGIQSRAEEYGPRIPKEACFLTCAVDTQDDRLEAEVLAWGPNEECWGIKFKRFLGNPAVPELWQRLDDFLNETYEHELGIKFRVAFTLIDSGGHFTQEVYKYCRARAHRNVYACKGGRMPSTPINSRITLNRATGSKLLIVGTDTAKSQIYSRLMIDKPGPGYMHYPKDKKYGYDLDYFKQLTAEKAVVKNRGGVNYRVWEKIRPRNEALDIRVYNHGALYFANVNLDRLMKRIERLAGLKKGEEVKIEENVDPETGEVLQDKPEEKEKPPQMPKKDWVSDW